MLSAALRALRIRRDTKWFMKYWCVNRNFARYLATLRVDAQRKYPKRKVS